jgi:recombination protein RecT
MSNELAIVKKDTVDIVANKVREFQERGELMFPPHYSPENAMKSAWLILQTTQDRNHAPVLQSCTKDSIANSLLDMVVQGLNPAKKQGYFIAYGKNLTFQRSYFGTMAVTKRVTEAKEINANVIYEGDDVTYEMENGKIMNLKHKQQFGNINKDKIIGAYCVIVMTGNEAFTELMTIDEIRKAWSKSQMWGKGQDEEKEGSTHEQYRQEMAKKTVINRACKRFMNASDDSSLVLTHFNGSDERVAEAEAEAEIQSNANGEVIDVDMKPKTETPKQEEKNINDQKEYKQVPLSSAPESVSDDPVADFETAAAGGPGY